MRFVASKTLAGELRGERIAAALGVPCSHQYSEPDKWVVFVKTMAGVKKAKQDGCGVILDPVDYYCYRDGREIVGSDAVDLLVIPSKDCAAHYKALFPKADFLVIPHQWDDRIEGQAPRDKFRPGYVGRDFNLKEELAIQMVTQDDEQLSSMQLFNCHVAAYSSPLKPATKVSSAAAVGANVVVTPTGPVLDLLGADYPFLATGTMFDALFRAKKAFGSEAWEYGLEVMAGVKEKTSMRAVCEKYRAFA